LLNGHNCDVTVLDTALGFNGTYRYVIKVHVFKHL
jgi:hypothetical protein